MQHDPQFIFSMVAAFLIPIFLLLSMMFQFKSLNGLIKTHQHEALKETNSLLREILEELKKQA